MTSQRTYMSDMTPMNNTYATQELKTLMELDGKKGPTK